MFTDRTLKTHTLWPNYACKSGKKSDCAIDFVRMYIIIIVLSGMDSPNLLCCKTDPNLV